MNLDLVEYLLCLERKNGDGKHLLLALSEILKFLKMLFVWF